MRTIKAKIFNGKIFNQEFNQQFKIVKGYWVENVDLFVQIKILDLQGNCEILNYCYV